MFMKRVRKKFKFITGHANLKISQQLQKNIVSIVLVLVSLENGIFLKIRTLTHKKV